MKQIRKLEDSAAARPDGTIQAPSAPVMAHLFGGGGNSDHVWEEFPMKQRSKKEK